MYYRIIPYEQSFDSYGLVYKIPDSYTWYNTLIWCLGQFPFWKKVFHGIFAELLDISYVQKLEYNIREMKWFTSETPILTSREIEMIDFIAEHYFCPIHLALKLYLSLHLIKEISSLKYFSRKDQIYNYTTYTSSLGAMQNDIYQKISRLPTWSISLLYGVTWSGKTHIYMHIIHDIIQQWWQVLFLTPEIILTSQVAKRLQDSFWGDVIIIHSNISPTKKTQYFKDIASWNAKVIIWTRSTLFYAYKNLQYIIMDEEHDRSYISDTHPCYHVKTVAQKMQEIYGCSVLLGSWTPEIRSFYKWLQWQYHLFQLLESYKE